MKLTPWPANKNRPLASLLLLCFCGTTACMTSSKQEELLAAIVKVDQKVQDLQAEISEKEKELSATKRQSEDSRSQNQELKNEIEDLKRQLALTQGSVDETKVKLNRMQETFGANPTSAAGTDLADPNATAAGESELLTIERRIARIELMSKANAENAQATASASTKATKGKAKSKFQTAAELSKALNKAYGQKEFKKVAALATEVIESKGTAEMQEVALEFRGTAYFQEQMFSEAALDFSTFLEEFPKSARRARALLFAGDSFVYLKKTNAAKSYYLECVTNFPEKEEGKAAKERLDKMGS